MRNFASTMLFVLASMACARGATVTWTGMTGGNWTDPTQWSSARTGTITTVALTTNVTGAGTFFTTELNLTGGDALVEPDGTFIGTVASVSDDTHLLLTGSGASVTLAGSA